MSDSTSLHEGDKPYIEIGQRLRQFARETFGSVSGLCRAIGRQETYFIRVLAGEYMPGGRMQALLRDVGCDIEWLITGKHAPISPILPAEIEERIVNNGPTAEDFQRISLELSRALRQIDDLKQQLNDLSRRQERGDSKI